MVGLAANEMEKEKRDLEVCLDLCLSLEVQCALRLKELGFVARPHVPSCSELSPCAAVQEAFLNLGFSSATKQPYSEDK